MDPRKPDCTNEKLANTAGCIATATKLAGAAAKGMGEVLPAPIKAAGHVAKVAEAAMKDKTPGAGFVETVACATAKVGTQVVMGAPLAARAAAVGAAAMPLPIPRAKGGAAAVAVAAAAPGIAILTEPYGKVAEKTCHAAFDFGKKIAPHVPNPFAEPVVPKQMQAKQAANNVAQSKTAYDAANLHAQQQAHQQVVAKTQSYNLPYNFRQHSPVIPSYVVMQAQNNAIWEFRLRYGSVPTHIENQIRNSISVSSLGYSSYGNQSLGMSEFSLSLMATNLITSYNMYHFQSSIYSPWGLYGDIGGVATEVSTISDLIDSEAHAAADAYYLCLPAKVANFPEAMFMQIQQELEHAFYTHKALPFFSLHFNQKGFLYPILHPAYQNTLIGEIIGLLDYFMKGFLNGGVFDPDFLKQWHETANCDETYLRSKIVDLKKYCKQYAPTVGYMSLRELESRYGVQGERSSSTYQQPFMTSFRIIASQQKIERHNNVLIPHPVFEVNYSVDLMPDYQQYVDNHVKEHGQLPPEYKQLRQCYDLYAQEVTEKMPQLPMCRDFFNLLGVINSLCYFYTTIEKMGKKPVVSTASADHTPFPKALPPIPVRYYKSYDFPLTMNDVLRHICQSPALTNTFNQQLAEMFQSQAEFPVALSGQIETIIKVEVLALLNRLFPLEPLTTWNDEDIKRITKQTCHKFKSIIHHFSSMMEDEVHKLIEKIERDPDLLEIAMDMERPLSYKMNHVNISLTASKQSWMKVTTSTTLDKLKDEWNDTTGIVSMAVEICNAEILALQQNKASELQNVPLAQKNNANVKAFEAMMDAKIAEYVMKISVLKGVEERFKTNSWVSKLSRLANKVDVTFEEKTRKIIIDAIEMIEGNVARMFQKFSEIMNNFSEKLLNLPPFTSQIISKKYTHTFIGFTGKELTQKAGDNIQIVGGCGMELPNLTSQDIPHAEVFCKSVAEALARSQTNKGQFEHNGTAYVVYQLPVYSVDAENTLATKSAVAQEQTVDPIKDDVLAQDKYGNLPIHSSARVGHVEAIVEMLRKNPALVEAKNKRGQTPLMIAVQFGQLPVMEVLRHADFNYCLPNGLFPLFMAIQRNFIPLALWMLQNISNLDVNKELDSKMTALHLAIQSKATELAIQLSKRGARCDIQRKSDGFTAVHCAAQLGNVDVLRVLLQGSVSVEQALESKKTLLHLAAAAGHVEAVKLLVERGANINAQTIDGDTPLMLSIMGGHIQTAELLANTTSVNTCNSRQQTASMLAQQYGMAAVGDALINRSEDPNRADKKGKSYLYYLIRHGEYQRFRQLIEMRKVNLRQLINGNSWLALAAQFGHFMIVDDLLGRSVAYTSTTKLSLLDYAVMADEIGYLVDQADAIKQPEALALQAVKSGSVRCLKFLLKKLSSTACQHPDLVRAAIASNNEKIILLILNHYSDINKPVDNEGNTLLHIAIRHGAHLVLEVLAKRGCQFTAVNVHKQTAFHLAISQEDDDLLKRLFKLSRPDEWPRDVWQTQHDQPSAISMVLQKYAKRLPIAATSTTSQVNQSVATGSKESVLPPCPLLLPKQLAMIDAFKIYISSGKLDNATVMIERNAFLANLFHTDKGGELFLHIVNEIEDNQSANIIATLVNAAQSSKSQFSEVNRLFSVLKDKGVNPVKYTREMNPLLAVMNAENDSDSSFRLKALAHYFPDCLSTLALDKSLGNATMAQIALSRNKLALFEQLDELCSKQLGASSKSFSGLHEAVSANQYELVERLLKRYAVDTVNNQGITPLMLAALRGNVSIINLLLQHGANVDQTDLKNQSVLHYALQNKTSEAAALTLLPLIKNPNKSNRKGVTPLMVAANKGMLSVMRSLCESSHDDVQTFDSQGHNALHHAALEGQVESITYLVSQGFQVDQPESPQKPDKPEKCRQRTPLHIAALKGHEEAIYCLLELKADPTKEDAQGNALTEYAVLGKNKEVLNLMRLLPYFNDKDRNQHLLHAAAISDNTDILSELILDNANPNSLDKNGRSALHLACIHNSGDMARLLLSGGDVVLNGLDKIGSAPVHYAAQYGHVRMLELLRAAGADMNQVNGKGETPMTLAKTNDKAGALLALEMQNTQTSKHKNVALINFGLYRRSTTHRTTGDMPLNVQAARK